MPAERAQGYGAHLVALLFAVFYFKFGDTLIDKPIEVLFREITCNSHYDGLAKGQIRAYPYDDPLCQIQDIENVIERGTAISLIFEAVGGLLTAYAALRFNYREKLVFCGSLTWIFAKLMIYFTTHDSWEMPLYWFLSTLVGGGRVVVEGAILGMLTDLSDEQNRARNLCFTFGAGLLSYLGANIASKPFIKYNIDASYIAAMTGIILGITTIAIYRCIFLKSYCSQAEDYRSEEETNWDRRPPRVQVLSRFGQLPSSGLLFIVAVLPPAAFLSMQPLASWIPRVFMADKVLLELPTSLYIFPITACVVTGTIIPMLENAPALRRNMDPQRRSLCLLTASFFLFSLGIMITQFSMGSKYSLLIGGLVLMGLGGGVVPLSLAMLVSRLGRRIRCRYIGRALGVVYTLQCLVRLVLVPMIHTMRKPGQPPMAQLVPQTFGLCTVYVAFALVWRWYAKNMASIVGGERDVELEEMRRAAAPFVAPSAPPPAYSPLARENGRI